MQFTQIALYTKNYIKIILLDVSNIDKMNAPLVLKIKVQFFL